MDQAGRQDFALAEADEATFIRAAQRGDGEAYLALARWHWAQVSAVLRGLTPVNQPPPPRTLDVFARGWRGIQYLPEGQRFHTWIHRIAVNLCQSSPRLDDEARGHVDATALPDVPAQIEATFWRMSLEHREALVLCLGFGLGSSDIARVVEIPPPAAAERLSKARATLYAERGGWMPEKGLRHFTLAQLCNFVGTDPASAPPFVREHLGGCPDCRAVLTGLESQDRILVRQLAGDPDPSEIEMFLAELEKLLQRSSGSQAPRGTESTKTRSTESTKTPSPVEKVPGEPRSVEVAPVASANAMPNPRRRESVVPVISGVALVVVVLLAVTLGPRLQPWLTSIGIRWGPPVSTEPPTQVAGAPRSPSSWAPPETVSQAPADSTRAEAAPPKETPAPKTLPRSTTVAEKRPASIAARPTRNPPRVKDESTQAKAALPRELLCGQVVDRDGRPVAAAEVVIGVEIVVFTDRAGRFCVAARVGDHRLTISKTGFAPLRQNVNVGPHSAELTWTLDPAPATP